MRAQNILGEYIGEEDIILATSSDKNLLQDHLKNHAEIARTQLRKHGRSFHWASHLLGKKTGDGAACLYAFCRQLDDIADDDIPHTHPSDNEARLKNFITAVQSSQAGIDPVLDEFLPIMHACNIPSDAIIHLLEGLISDQDIVAISTQDQLILYCYQVAGTVGRMMCPILGCHAEDAIAFAIDMGIGMQLTNIARDVLEDAKMGRRYLPGEWIDGLSAKQIVDASEHPDSHDYKTIQKAVARILALADEYYKSGESGLCYLPVRARISIAVAARVYREIGVQLKVTQYLWGNGRMVTSKWQKAKVSVPAICAHIFPSKPPLRHQPHLHSALNNTLQTSRKGFQEDD